MTTFTCTDKAGLRAEVLADFATISPDERRRRSEALAARLLGLPELAGGRKALMAFLSMDDELDTAPLLAGALAAGHRVYCPRTLRKARALVPVRLGSLGEVRTGAYGIRVPAGEETLAPAELDLVVVPAVAYDRRGFRLGRGGGYYDRFLERLAPGAATVGVIFARHVLAEVPREAHDKAVRLLVTEEETLAAER